MKTTANDAMSYTALKPASHNRRLTQAAFQLMHSLSSAWI